MTVLQSTLDPKATAYTEAAAGGDDAARRDRRRTRQSAWGRRAQVCRPPPRPRQADRPGTHRAARRPGLPVSRAEPAGGVRQRLPDRCQHSRRHRRGQRRGMPDRRQRPDGQGRHQQPVDPAKDTAGQPDRPTEPVAGDLAGGIRRRRPAHPEGDFRPWRADVPRPDPAVGGRDPHHRAGIRQLHRGWRLHTRDVRPRGDDQGTLEGVPGRPPAGEDGHRRGVRRRVAGRRRNACPHLGFGRLLRPRRARRDPHRTPHRGPAELGQTGTRRQSR